jgi:ABC-type bacteriocin/lantibiotic exporter with double-glycine peptidase domain
MSKQNHINLISSLNALQDIDLTSLATFISIAGLFLLSSHIRLNPSHIIFAMAFCSRINSSVGYHVSTAIKIVFSLGPALRRLEKFLNKKNDFCNLIQNNAKSVKIEIRNLVLPINQVNLLIRDFDVSSNQLTVIVGDNGSGKVFFYFLLILKPRSFIENSKTN